ncbi:MAG: RadC family protein [Myxococcota bacterium]
MSQTTDSSEPRSRTAARRRPSDSRPRERLHAHGAETLADGELLALVLRTGARGVDAPMLARELLERFGGLRGLARAARAELATSRGMGPAKAAAVVAALELGRRLAGRRMEPGEPVRGPEDVHRHYHWRLRDRRVESFLAILLDSRHRILRDIEVSTGTLTASLVHPREVFRPALREAAAALILVHNHPSGDPAPSAEDRAVTRRLAESGELLGIRVLDHVVVAERGYFSFRDAGDLPLGGSSARSRLDPAGQVASRG